MNIALAAPCPVPYVVGGAEIFLWGLQRHVNERTEHRAEIIKLPSPERTFDEVVDSYRRWSELDLSGFDLVVPVKYPAWMVAHERLVPYVFHRLRGLYDTYHFFGLPERHPDNPLRDFMDENAGRREALPELFDRLAHLRRAPGVPEDLFAFPGPFIREVVHFLDGVGLAPEGVHHYVALSATVRDREGYFPAGADVGVAHGPATLPGLREGRGSHLFSVSRLDNPKRMELLVQAMAHVKADVELLIAGTGPEEERLRELIGGDRRIRLLGAVGGRELADLYATSRAVAFVPYLEDYGLVTVEAMCCGKPVVTCSDSGGPTEIVQDGVNGFVVDPAPEAVAEAVDRLWGDRRLRRRMGRAARDRASSITWDGVVAELVR